MWILGENTDARYCKTGMGRCTYHAQSGGVHPVSVTAAPRWLGGTAMGLRRMLFGVGVMLLHTTAVNARTWHIRADGSGDAPTIQAGIQASAGGDTILIAPGTYQENLRASEPLVISGEGDPTTTIVDGSQAGSVLLVAGGVVQKLTLRNGFSTTGGGIYVYGSAHIHNNIVEDNAAGMAFDSGIGGGIYVHPFADGVLIESNIIRNNTAGNVGGGIAGAATIRANIIIGNASHNAGGGIMGGTVVTDNIIAGNYTDNQGAGIVSDGDVQNNTIIGNIVGQPGVAINVFSSTTVSRNIFCLNTSLFANGLANAVECSNCVLECNDIWGNDNDALAGFGNVEHRSFSMDPEFCAVSPVASLNFTLQSDSPCAAGNNPGGVDCGTIGASPVGCGTVMVKRRTWTDVKSMYR